MRFLTEQDLRVLFNNKNISSYKLEEGYRLTPGGRQFLLDKKVDIIDENIAKDSNIKNSETIKNSNEKDLDINLSLDYGLLKSKCIEKARYIYDYNQETANFIFDIEEAIEDIEKDREMKLKFTPCLGMDEKDSMKLNEDCFLIDRDMVLMSRGREISILHYLRSELKNFIKNSLKDIEIKKRMYVLVNMISQKIHLMLGGSQCQRQI